VSTRRKEGSVDGKQPHPRRRDSAASRERLLKAAGELFADRGFDQTTARDIGERAGVDPTMIARYFDGKAQLYIAVLLVENGPDVPADLLNPARLAAVIERTDRQGPGPTIQAAVRPYDDPAAQTAACEELYRRMVNPLRDRLIRDGHPQPELHAEVLTAAFIGVVLARRTGSLHALATADADQLVTLLQDVLTAS
jgi:AcrR family transcriptional regulator